MGPVGDHYQRQLPPARHVAIHMATYCKRRTQVKGRNGSIGPALFGLGLTLLAAPGLWAAGYSYKEVARLDTKAPGGGMLVNDFEPGRISGQGEVAFVVDYDASNSEGLYLASNGALIPIVEPGKAVGTAAPDWSFIANGPIGMLLSPVGMNASGDVAFGSDAQKKGDSDVHTGNFLWIRKTGQMVVANLYGDNAPDHGMFGDTHGSTWVTVNDQDDVAFASDVSDAQGTFAQAVFVRTNSDGKVHTVARAGDKLGDGSTFVQARRPNLNNAGVVVFEGTTDKDDSVRIYQYKDGQITALAAPDTDLTGIGKLVEVKRPRLNNNGAMIFLGRTDAGWGVYSLADGKFSAVVQPGADLRDGSKLDEAVDKDGSDAIADSGDIAMLLTRAADSTRGVYVMHAGQLVNVAHNGMDLAGVGTVDDLGDDEHVAINSAGQLAFQVPFKDGHTGLILATPIP